MADMQQHRLIGLYQAMAGVTAAMLAAARDQDWEALPRLEAECAAHVATLKRAEALAALPAQEGAHQDACNNAQKAALIAQMLADDSEIRQRVAARMTRLSGEMNSASTERKLARAYQS